MSDLVSRLAEALPKGGRIGVGDGSGHPTELWPEVVDLLRERPDVSALVGLSIEAPERVEELSGERVRTVISGFGMCKPIDRGQIGFLPVRLGNVPALLRGPLRLDLLIATLRPVNAGYSFTSEVSWQRAAIAAGARVMAVVRNNAPGLDQGPVIPAGEVVVLAESQAAPEVFDRSEPSSDQHAVAERVADLVPEGARIEVGPGAIGTAVYAALRRSVAVDTGLITDSVQDLAARGLLDGPAYGPYAMGTEQFYDWAPGNVVVDGFESTHDPCRLASGRPLFAINSALEIDLDGQVNAETVAGSAVGGIGGHPDYAGAAAISKSGLSIVAMTTRSSGRPTLVERLQGPMTTPGHDVEIVVTERGVADLRALSRPERRAALAKVWGMDAP